MNEATLGQFPVLCKSKTKSKSHGIRTIGNVFQIPRRKSLYQRKLGTILKHNSIRLISLLTYCSKLWYFPYYFMLRAIERLMLQVKQTVWYLQPTLLVNIKSSFLGPAFSGPQEKVTHLLWTQSVHFSQCLTHRLMSVFQSRKDKDKLPSIFRNRSVEWWINLNTLLMNKRDDLYPALGHKQALIFIDEKATVRYCFQRDLLVSGFSKYQFHQGVLLRMSATYQRLQEQLRSLRSCISEASRKKRVNPKWCCNQTILKSFYSAGNIINTWNPGYLWKVHANL